MSVLHVKIQSDGGTERMFSGHGDGQALVAAFRAWLASPACELPAAAGADELERAASADEVEPEMSVEQVQQWLVEQLAQQNRPSEDMFAQVAELGITRARFRVAMEALMDGGHVFGRRVDDEIWLSSKPLHAEPNG